MHRLAFLPLLGALVAGAHAQSDRVSHAPSFALAGPNWNGTIPFGEAQIRWQEIYDPDTFTRQEPLLLRGIAFRPTTEQQSWEAMIRLPGGTFEIALRIGLAAPGVTSKSLAREFDLNIDAASVKTVIARKRIDYPAPGRTVAALFEFGVRLPFDQGMTFAFDPTQKRALVVEISKYDFGRTWSMDFWSEDATRGMSSAFGFTERAGAYRGCNAKIGRPVELSAEATTLVPGRTAQIRGQGWHPVIPAFLFLGGREIDVLLPGTTCRLKAEPDLLVVGLTSMTADGRFDVAIPVPDLEAMAGLRFVAQMLFFNPGANALGLTSTRALLLGIGRGRFAGGGIAVAYTSGFPDTARFVTWTGSHVMVTEIFE